MKIIIKKEPWNIIPGSECLALIYWGLGGGSVLQGPSVSESGSVRELALITSRAT